MNASTHTTPNPRANWRHIYRNARLIRDVFSADPDERSPMAAALFNLHNELPTPIYLASMRAAISGRRCARRPGDLLGIFPITDAPLRQYRNGAPAPRLPA